MMGEACIMDLSGALFFWGVVDSWDYLVWRDHLPASLVLEISTLPSLFISYTTTYVLSLRGPAVSSAGSVSEMHQRPARSHSYGTYPTYLKGSYL